MKTKLRATFRVLLLLSFLCVLLCPIQGFSQEPEPARFGAFGLGYFAEAVPQFQGWSALAIPITADGKALSYTAADWAVVNDESNQLTVAGRKIRYTMKTGIAYRIFQRGTWSLFGLAAPGFVADGDTFKSAFSYGGFIYKDIGKGWGAILALTNENYGGKSDLAPRAGVSYKF